MAGLLACADMARGYLVGPALSLDKLTEEADIIFKGRAVSGGPVQDEWFKPYNGFIACQTEFKVVSVSKGEARSDKVMFRHYDQSPDPRGYWFQPQYYHFEAGSTYIVFAKRSGPDGVVRQLWMNHNSKRLLQKP